MRRKDQIMNISKDDFDKLYDEEQIEEELKSFLKDVAMQHPREVSTKESLRTEEKGKKKIGKFVKVPITKLGATVRNIGQTLYNKSPAKWIDDLEHDQHLADKLEDINIELQEDHDRHMLRQEAAEATFQLIQQHLEEFLNENPDAMYEEWIEKLHPENVHSSPDSINLVPTQDSTHAGRNRTRSFHVDHRFYVEDSDHRRMWNDAIRSDEQFVPPQSLLK
mmetsp:Transcript_29083/g.40726  ORF Transcript_29083/g.40726 Transcript_29083/m.40726 type:complete len:221 (-) Transcript_29083:192-854(-)